MLFFFYVLSNLLYTPDVKVFYSTAVFHVGTDRDRRTHILAFIFICEVKEKKNVCILISFDRRKIFSYSFRTLLKKMYTIT